MEETNYNTFYDSVRTIQEELSEAENIETPEVSAYVDGLISDRAAISEEESQIILAEHTEPLEVGTPGEEVGPINLEEIHLNSVYGRLNSPELLPEEEITVEEDSREFSRFSGADWMENSPEEYSILIGGAGGIGSWTALFLARIGFNLFLKDFDTIEEHNVGGQMFRNSDIGNLKVVAIQDIINSMTNYPNLVVSSSAVTEDTEVRRRFCISAFDNMEARSILFEKWKHHVLGLTDKEQEEAIFIDGRLELETFQIFCVTIHNWDKYEEKYLFPDSEGAAAPACTLKQTSHFAGMIGSLITSFFTNHLVNINLGIKARSVPLFYEYFGPLNSITIIDE